MTEDEYVKGITTAIKQHLLDVTTTIATETLKKISEKVKEYGFIKIGERY